MKFFENQLYTHFHLNPTQGQKSLFRKLSDFMEEKDEKCIFLLKGYAGTGKTTVLDAFIKSAPSLGYQTVLMAPTGRAAKVMNQYTGRYATTIHRSIYTQSEDSITGAMNFRLQKNKAEDTVFIVDEASMITELRELGTNGLLRDLVAFVFESFSNKLVLIGDDAQLPPIGLDTSPALDLQHLEGFFHAKVFTETLTEVMRQESQSGILNNATELRRILNEENIAVRLNTKGFRDFFKMSSERIEDGLRYAYEKYGQENTIVITQSNKNAVLYNQLIRYRINYSESEIDNGDILMVVRNNYNTLGPESRAGFLANGEFVKVIHLGREEKMHGFRFQQANLALVDYPEDPEFDTLIMLDTLYSNSPSLTQEQNQALYESVVEDYQWVKTAKERKKMIREDKYLNALQVKFAYALTCHKSQGGQWPIVFIDQYWIRDKIQNKEFVRWLYTAVTRGIHEVYLVNFQPELFQ